jgi:hypothetical protein
MIGQINLDSSAGKLLSILASSLDIKTIVEIGTWNGCGSTQCLLHGMQNNIDKFLITIELYPDQFEIALNNLQNKNNVKLLHGSILTPEEAAWLDKSEIDFNDLHAKMYYDLDMEYIKSYPNVFNLIPNHIDLLVLDGGEYTTYPEWQKLKSRTSYVFLDDTNILKCKKIREELLSDINWICIEDNINSRNGYAAFKKI